MKSRNFLASMVDVVGGLTATVEFSTVHGMETTDGRKTIPREFLVVDQLQAGSLYRGGTTWTDTLAYFKSDAGSPRFTVVFF